MLDLVKMEESFAILVEENAYIVALASQSKFILSLVDLCEECIRSSTDAVLKLDEAREEYRNKPSSENMFLFKLAFENVAAKNKDLGKNLEAKREAMVELEVLQKKHQRFMPAFFAAQIYLCNK